MDTVFAHLELTPFIGVRGPLGAGGGHEASLGRSGKRGCSVARSGRKQVAQLGRRPEPRVERGKCDCFSPRLCGTFQRVSQLRSWGLPGATRFRPGWRSDVAEVARSVPGLPETAEGRTAMVTLARHTAGRIQGHHKVCALS